jgi:hypothetical protein
MGACGASEAVGGGGLLIVQRPILMNKGGCTKHLNKGIRIVKILITFSHACVSVFEI